MCEIVIRIIGKAILSIVRKDVLKATGCMQLCAGQTLGCEATFHSICSIYEDSEMEAITYRCYECI